MATWIKLGCFGDLHSLAAEGLRKVEKLYASKGKDLHITSLREGTHNPGSLHWLGFAWDQRPDGIAITEIKSAVGPNFDVVKEIDHLHIEFDPHQK